MASSRSGWRELLVLTIVALACKQESGAGTRVDTDVRNVRIDGDTTGLPPSCTPSAAVAALAGWFRAVSTGDTRAISASVSPRFDWVSVAPFAPQEPLFTTHEWADLTAYVKRRSQAHERVRLESVTFTGWRSGMLQFGPLYLDRSADDLGPTPMRGIGKGAYKCGEGLVALSIASCTDPRNSPRGLDSTGRPAC
jgi:hypothetical protein